MVREKSFQLPSGIQFIPSLLFSWYFWCPLGSLTSLLTSPLHRIPFSSKYTASTYLNASSLAAVQLCSSLSILICMMFPSKLTSGYICTSNYNIKTINSPITYDSEKCLSKQLAVPLCPVGQADSDFVPWLQGLNSKPRHEHPTEGRLRQEGYNSKRCREMKKPAWNRSFMELRGGKKWFSFILSRGRLRLNSHWAGRQQNIGTRCY